MWKRIKALFNRADLLKHFIAGAGITLLFFGLIQMKLKPALSLILAAILALAAGILKEVYDARHPETHTAELVDIIFVILGVACVAACLLLVIL